MVRMNFTNDSDLKKTVFGITGYYVDPSDASKVIAKISKDAVTIVVKPGKVSYLKYRFSPQIEAGEVGLLVVLEYYDSDETGYKSIGALEKITVVYGDSVYDFQRYFLLN